MNYLAYSVLHKYVHYLGWYKELTQSELGGNLAIIDIAAQQSYQTLRTYYLLLYRAFKYQYHHSIKMYKGSISRSPSRTMVVFGGSIFDYALAIDFVAISKTLTAHGLNSICLASTYLLDMIKLLNLLLVLGRVSKYRTVYIRLSTYVWMLPCWCPTQINQSVNFFSLPKYPIARAQKSPI